jgi:predicted nucleotidyltransferase
LDRATSEHQDLFNAEAYDYEAAGARLLARDLVKLLDQGAVRRVLEILSPEAIEEGPLLLAQQSGFPLETARRLVGAFCDELAASGRSSARQHAGCST